TALGFIFYTSLILMQRLFDLAGVIIKRSLSLNTVGKLLLWSLPHIVVLTVPMSLLFGILIAIGRLSSDSEIIAMRSLGVSTRAIYRPVFVFSFAMFLLTLYLTNFVLPRGNRNFVALRAEVFTSSVAKEIKPRVFYDDYENLMIYVNDVDPRTGLWKGVFVADTRGDETQDLATPQGVINASQEPAPTVGALASHSGQRVIAAQGGNLSIVKANRQVWLNLKKAETHIWDPRKPDHYDLNRNDTQRILLPDKSVLDTSQVARSLRELDLKQLLSQARDLRHGDPDTYRLAWVEIHKKFSIPFACIVFGILGLPLGITNRRGGKSSGFSLSIAIIVFYYVLIINGEHMAAGGKIPPWLGMWAANIILLALGIYLLRRAGRDSGQRSEGGFFTRLAGRLQARKARREEQRQQVSSGVVTTSARVEDEPMILNTLDITFPNILDRYILREFLKILGLVLISTVALFMVISYTDLANDIRRNHIAGSMVLSYYRFQIFYVLNYTLPISVLVATLVTFGLLAKNNEVTALKSGGVSLYRVSLPIIAVAAVLSVFAYFLLDFILPFANERAMKLENVIRGRTTASSLSTQQKTWFLGKGRYLINFLSYDRRDKVLSQVQVFELHPTEFRITRRVYAERAQWDGQGWVFSNGWMRSFNDSGASTDSDIKQPLRLYYAEKPEDFATEAKSPDQMTFAQLRRYVGSIRNSGYSAEELTVKLYAKTSWPALSLVMALIALPFAFRIGKRGALYGFGIALVLGIMYWMVFVLFTKFGEVGNLPPVLAAWSANILFSIGAVYMFAHAET
ncbi:MAG TPA: LPS export ABC transporter permease LptG, partial [Thermoanaerobaculia bacterium]|nr:LPS export ABC transporter permease LptG [Thermoanaerobaculia bacterium]